jgi:hypothetical protein
MKVTDVGAAYDAQFERVEVSNKLREAAQAALLALKCLDGLECAREEIEALEAALAEPAFKDSLTTEITPASAPTTAPIQAAMPIYDALIPEKKPWFSLAAFCVAAVIDLREVLN